jgi:hypothetical protein
MDTQGRLIASCHTIVCSHQFVVYRSQLRRLAVAELTMEMAVSGKAKMRGYFDMKYAVKFLGSKDQYFNRILPTSYIIDFFAYSDSLRYPGSL